MVLESLINPFKSEKRVVDIFFIGVLYSSAAIFLSNWIFKEHASLLMVFLTVLASVPLIYALIVSEEQKDIVIKEERALLKEHSKIIKLLLFLFLGFVISFTFWYIVLPSGLVQDTFHVQTLTIQAINTQVTGNYSSTSTLVHILLNNMKVLIFCILFAFLYGVGAIFILTWNASVIATAIGNFIRTNLTNISSKLGIAKLAAYFQIISLGLLRYFLHGIPEILAYFIAGLAGSIISVAVIREKFGTKSFEKIILDSSNLILLAIVFLLLAGLIEVYVTPLLF